MGRWSAPLKSSIVNCLMASLAVLCGPISGAGQAGFTDITEESGLAAIVEKHYAAYPKLWLSGLHLVDLDGDDDLDFFMSSHGQGPPLATLNDGTGRFVVAPGVYPNTEILLPYDIDEDGLVDLSARYQDGGAQWWRNLSQPGRLSFKPTGIRRGTNTSRRQAMIDIDRDGKVDWLRGRGGSIRFDLADGKGGFRGDSASLATDSDPRAEVLSLPLDLDGDGDIDLLSEWGHYGAPKGNSRILRNNGKIQFTDVTAEAGLRKSNISIKGAGDVDQDGDPDLIILEDCQRFELYLNDGAGNFSRKVGAVPEAGRKPSYASWGIALTTDFDNDGIADIIANGKHFLKIFRGKGSGDFVYVNEAWGIADLSASSIDDGMCFGDIDGDGDLDIIGYTSISGQRLFAVYRNDLPHRNWIRVRPIGLPGNRGAAGAKIRIYDAGTDRLLWSEQVAIYNSQAAAGYYGGAQTERHYGLGTKETVDVSVELYPSGKVVRRRNANANQTTVVREDAPADTGSQTD